MVAYSLGTFGGSGIAIYFGGSLSGCSSFSPKSTRGLLLKAGVHQGGVSRKIRAGEIGSVGPRGVGPRYSTNMVAYSIVVLFYSKRYAPECLPLPRQLQDLDVTGATPRGHIQILLLEWEW